MSFSFGFDRDVAEEVAGPGQEQRGYKNQVGAALPWGAGALVYEPPQSQSATKRKNVAAPGASSSRRRISSPQRPPKAVPAPKHAKPAPEERWPSWTAPEIPADYTLFEIDGEKYCYNKKANDKRVPVHSVLRNGSLGPVVGSRQHEGMSLSPGEWVGELLRAGNLPDKTPGVQETVLPPAAITALATGHAWTQPSVIDHTTLTEAQAEVERLLRTGCLSSRNHGQNFSVRDDLVAFLPLAETLTNQTQNSSPQLGSAVESCPPALSRCYQVLSNMAAQAGVSCAVTGCPDPLMLPPVGMVAVYDGKNGKYVAHRDNDLIHDPKLVDISGNDGWRWRNARVLTAILYLNAAPSVDQDQNTWDSERDGGCLRTWPSHRADTAPQIDSPSIDITPHGGTAVLFDSRRLWHAVQPARRRRVAVSAWFVSRATVC